VVVASLEVYTGVGRAEENHDNDIPDNRSPWRDINARYQNKKQECYPHHRDSQSTIIWDITPCSPLNVNRRLVGTYLLHLQGRRISRVRNKPESRWQAEWYVPSKRRLTFNGLHGVISENILLFITNAVRTSNPTSFFFIPS
jgi:hypothetical protein